MDKEETNKISANIKYLTECANIIYTKIRATEMKYINGNNQEQNIINVEDYRHGTITITKKSSAVKVCLDGTNYEVLFKRYKNNGFKFYNKELGIKYSYIDKKLDDDVHLKELVRVVGNNVDYFKYTSIGDFICVLKYASKDKDGSQSVDRYVVDDSNIQELIEYTKKKMEDEDALDVEEPDILNADEYMENPKFLQKLKEKEDEEIRSQIENYDSSDYRIIEFSLPDSFVYQISSNPYSCVLPERVQDFDEGEYFRRVLEEDKRAERRIKEEISLLKHETTENLSDDCDNIKFEEDSDYDDNPDIDIDSHDGDDPDDNIDLYDENCALDNEEDYTSDNKEDSDCEDYKIYYSQKDDKITEEDIIYMAASKTLDADLEIKDIDGFCEDIENFVRKVQAIIKGRKRKLDSQGDGFDDAHNGKKDENTEPDRA